MIGKTDLKLTRLDNLTRPEIDDLKTRVHALEVQELPFVTLATAVMVAMQPSPAAAIPATSEIRITLPPRARTSCRLDTVLSNSGPDGAITITGT